MNECQYGPNSMSADNQVNEPIARPRRSWVRPVIAMQCVAVLGLGTAVAIVSGVLQDNDLAGETGRAASPAPVLPLVEDDSPEPEHSPLIVESSIARSSDAEPPSQSSPANDQVVSIAASDTEHAANNEHPDVDPPKPDDQSPAKKEKRPTEKSPREQPSTPQPGNPLEQLPKAVEILDSLTSLGESAIGPLSMPVGFRLDIELHGGDTAHQVKIREDTDRSPGEIRQTEFGQTEPKRDATVHYDGVPTFLLRETFDEEGNTFWLISLTDYRGAIARLWLSQGRLRFKWTENAGRYEESGYLANCVLLITVPELARVHTLLLRKPIQAQPAPIDFVRGTATTEYPVPFMPPDATLAVEVIGATSNLPQPAADLDRWLSTNRDFIYFKFGNGAPLVVKVLASTKYAEPNPRIVTAAFFNLPRVAENVPGTLSQLASVRARTERAMQLLDGKSREVRAYQAQMQRLDWLETVARKTEPQPGITFRIVHLAGEHAIDLVHGGS